MGYLKDKITPQESYFSKIHTNLSELVALHTLTLMLLVAVLTIQKDAKKLRNAENLAYGYPSESTQRELSNEYQHDRV